MRYHLKITFHFINTEEKIKFVVLEKKKNLLFMIPAAWAQALLKNSWKFFISEKRTFPHDLSADWHPNGCFQ